MHLNIFVIVIALDNEGSNQGTDAAKSSPDENQQEVMGDARGVTGLEEHKNQNFVLVFGCKSGMGIGAKSVMASDFSNALLASYDANDLTCTLSDVLDTLIGTDVNFEIVKAQTVRPLKMNYVHNKVDVIRAFIFVQTELDGFAKAINAKAIAEGVKQ